MLDHIFESHAHYDDEAFTNDCDALLSQFPQLGIERVINVGASMASSRRSLQLANCYDHVYAALGVHPNETAELTEADMAWIRNQCQQPKVAAIGEIGLDYYWKEPSRDIQKHWFIRQLDLAKEVHLPVIIHSRDAAKDTLDIMKAERADKVPGVIHCYSYSVELAREFFNLGYYFGIGGVLTFENARRLKEVAAYLPIDCLLLETDSPYLAPVPHRGTRNDSRNLPYVATMLADIKKMDVQEVIDCTRRNAYRLFSKTTPIQSSTESE